MEFKNSKNLYLICDERKRKHMNTGKEFSIAITLCNRKQQSQARGFNFVAREVEIV